MFCYTPPTNALKKKEPHKSLTYSKGFYCHDSLETRYLNDISKATEMKVQDIPLSHSLRNNLRISKGLDFKLNRHMRSISRSSPNKCVHLQELSCTPHTRKVGWKSGSLNRCITSFPFQPFSVYLPPSLAKGSQSAQCCAPCQQHWFVKLLMNWKKGSDWAEHFWAEVGEKKRVSQSFSRHKFLSSTPYAG